jgi:hypothetical protein
MSGPVDKTARKLQKIVRLHRGTSSTGERAAAAAAFDRVRRSTQYEIVSIENFDLRSCGCVTIPCRHWAAMRKPPSKSAEQIAIEAACREALKIVRNLLAWDAEWEIVGRVYPLYDWNWRSSQPRLLLSEVNTLYGLARQFETLQRAPTARELAIVKGLKDRASSLDAIRLRWAKERARRQAAAAHVRAFRKKQRGSKLKTAAGV